MNDVTKSRIDEILSSELSLQALEGLINEVGLDAEALDYIMQTSAADDPELEEYLVDSRRSAYAREQIEDYGAFIPASAHAAKDGHNLCDFECESFILSELGIEYDKTALGATSRQNYWLRSAGTPLFNMGKLMELNGLYVNRSYNENLDSLEVALTAHKVIVVVNGDTLDAKEIDIFADDFSFDDSPNHAVVVLGIDREKRVASIFNPARDEASTEYPLDLFLSAWGESKNYMVAARLKKDEFEYNPQPIDTSCVVLNKELLDLVEFLSENAHDVWAQGKMEKGYSYGSDDENHNHFLKPYHLLTEVEKDQDRDNVLATVKMLKRLGYRLVNVNNMHKCPHCGEAIEPNNNFCPSCGRQLSWEDFK